MKNNKVYQSIAITLLSGLAQVSFADNYNSETTASYAGSDSEFNGQAKSVEELGSIAHRIYFSEVDTSTGPLAKAAFVSRASSFAIAYTDSNIFNNSIDSFHTNLELRNEESGLTFSFDYADVSNDIAGVDSFNVGVGKYIGDTTEVSISYNRIEADDVASSVADLPEQQSALSLAVSHVGVGDVGFALDASASVADMVTDNERLSIAVAATVYPTPKLGIGAGFRVALADEDDDALNVYAQWFFNPKFMGTATYFTTDQNDQSDSGMRFSLSLCL